MTTKTGIAILGGGCFWELQDLLRRQPGVISTRVGYTGGEVPNATEAIEIVFDPRQIGFHQVLEFFFQTHDPTTNTGSEIAKSYPSAIFYRDHEQKHVAENTVADVYASGLWHAKVITKIVPAGPFWEAVPEHQDHLERHQSGYSSHLIRPDRKLSRRG